MADGSKIEWTDATWNPVTGCTKVSPGCDHCYAERIVERFKGKGSFATVVRSEEKLYAPLKWRTPRRVFVNSMSDLFHDDVPLSFIELVFSVMARTPRHSYQLLTKRHARMRSVLSQPTFHHTVSAISNKEIAWPLPNVWLGVSVENQQWADIRIPALIETPAAVRFLSCEPLLGPIDLDVWTCSCQRRRWVDDENWSPEYPEEWRGERSPGDGRIPCGFCNHGGWNEDDIERPGIDWVIAGGESGLNSRPMQVDWARSLRDQCTKSGVAFFFKQWGGRTPKANGRELDGRTWDEYPEADGGH